MRAWVPVAEVRRKVSKAVTQKIAQVLTVPSEAAPFVDVTGKLVGLRTSGIQWLSYQEVPSDAHKLVERLAEAEIFSDEELSHRRGKYPNVSFGISMGNGQNRPKLLELGAHVEELRNSEPFKRITGFTDCKKAQR